MLPVPVPELSGDILKVVASHVTVKYRWELLRGYKTGSLISFSRPGKSWSYLELSWSYLELNQDKVYVFENFESNVNSHEMQ